VSRLAFGVKAHSGWAALVALGEGRAGLEVAERRRLELVDAQDAHWAKQPYHAADGRGARDAEEVVTHAIAAAGAHAQHQLESVLASRRARGDEVIACAVLLGTGMPPWTLPEVLAVHARMHKAEGELFRGALARAAERIGLELIGVREKQLEASASEALSLTTAEWRSRLAEAGQRAGPPWARDQKEAALCAWIALRRAGRG
jgi:hypothetical protein